MCVKSVEARVRNPSQALGEFGYRGQGLSIDQLGEQDHQPRRSSKRGPRFDRGAYWDKVRLELCVTLCAHTRRGNRRPIMPSANPTVEEASGSRRPTRLDGCRLVCVVRSTLDRSMNGSISIIRSLSACFDIGLDWSTHWGCLFRCRPNGFQRSHHTTSTPTPTTTHRRQQTAAARRRKTHVHTHGPQSGGDNLET